MWTVGGLRRVRDPEAWALDFGDCEFVVRGGEDGPEPALFDLAERFAGQSDEFVRVANDYLAAFVVPERFEASGL
jgi:hypothetical protein